MKYLPRILGVLLFLVMVTLPSAGHTYAEYASEDSGSDSSRISKFGITATCDSTAFAVSYTNVNSANSDKVMAPGTTGTLVTFSASGTSEVRTKVTKTATITMNDSWIDGSGAFYCPLVFTFKNGSTTLATINGLDYTSKDDLIAALKAELEVGNASHSPGYNYATGSNYQRNNRTVTWTWPFKDGASSDGATKQTMTKDTTLAKKATKPTISMSVTFKIEQVQ